MRPTDSDTSGGQLRTVEPELMRFLRVYAPGLVSAELVDRVFDDAGLFLSVVVRTQGNRRALLREALLCLAGQESTNFEVLVVAHDPSPEAWQGILADCVLLQTVLPGRVQTLEAHGGTRTRPVAVGVENARGRYAVVLDDDDYVTADWVSTFQALWELAPGRVLRAASAVRRSRFIDFGGDLVRIAAEAPDAVYRQAWSLPDHVVENRTPFHAFAFPLYAIDLLGLRFDEELEVVEDWDFLLRVAGGLGVSETGQITSLYNQGSTDSSAHVVRKPTWAAAEVRIRERHRTTPSLSAPPDGSRSGAADQLAEDLDAAVSRSDAVRRIRRSVAYVYATEGVSGVFGRLKLRARERMGGS